MNLVWQWVHLIIRVTMTMQAFLMLLSKSNWLILKPHDYIWVECLMVLLLCMVFVMCGFSRQARVRVGFAEASYAHAQFFFVIEVTSFFTLMRFKLGHCSFSLCFLCKVHRLHKVDFSCPFLGIMCVLSHQIEKLGCLLSDWNEFVTLDGGLLYCSRESQPSVESLLCRAVSSF